MPRINLETLKELKVGDGGFTALCTFYDEKLWGSSSFGAAAEFCLQFIKFQVTKTKLLRNGTISFQIRFPALKESYSFKSDKFIADEQVQKFYFFGNSSVLPENASVLEVVAKDAILFPNPATKTRTSVLTDPEIPHEKAQTDFSASMARADSPNPSNNSNREMQFLAFNALCAVATAESHAQLQRQNIQKDATGSFDFSGGCPAICIKLLKL